MLVSCAELEGRIRDEFPSKYRRFGGFIDSGDLWNEFCKMICNAEYLSHVCFCNDVMKIPPVKTHMMYSEFCGGAASGRDLTVVEKQSIGAVYGFLFKEMFGYTQQESVSCVINTIKTAARFSGMNESICFE